MMAVMHEVFLGLGSNLGNREELLCRACDEIERLVGPVVGRSAFIETVPWGFQSQHPFLNAVVRCHTSLAPLALLGTTQHIERLLGKRNEHATTRIPSGNALGSIDNYHDRPIDIDVLLYDCLTINEPRLKVPHPLMRERDFVMKPLRQLLVGKDDGKYLHFIEQTL